MSFCCTQPFSLSASFGIGRLLMKMAAENSPVERLTEPKNAIKTTWPKALQGSLKIRWRPFNCGSPPIKKVLALNSYSLCPESGTLQSSLVCCRMLILLPSSLRTSASYPPQHKGHQARVRPAPLNVFANPILMLFVKPTTVFLNHAQEIRLRPDCPNRKHGCPLTDERQISHGEA